jgi:23S rRNA (adenine2503-C2)-methyltransferase
MGCGEPLDNFEQTIRFIELITHPKGVNIGQRHITLSTCGLVPQILHLAELKLQITLAISLHGATDETRQKLMPIAKRYPLNELMQACEKYIQATNRRVTFEYALAKGENDSSAHARDLAKLLRGINCHVNLIPINKARGKFHATQRKEADAFASVLLRNKIQTTIRRSLGSDVNAACGQLRAGSDIV